MNELIPLLIGMSMIFMIAYTVASRYFGLLREVQNKATEAMERVSELEIENMNLQIELEKEKSKSYMRGDL